MKNIEIKPKSHIFICTHTRPEGEACCGRVGGAEFLTRMKMELTEKKLRNEHWITRSGCLGYCNFTGCVAAIYKSPGDGPQLLTEIVSSDYQAVWNKLVE